MEISIPKYLKSFIRVLHVSPKTPTVDIYINNSPVIKELRYRGFTEYMPIAAGTYNIKIYVSGTNTVLLNDTITIDPNKILTIAAIGLGPKSLSLFPILDPKLNIDNTKAYLRFIQLSPNTPPVDIVTSNGIRLFKNTSYKQKQNYIQLNPQIYAVDMKLADTTTSILYVPNIKLMPNKFYTIYSVGLLNDNPPLQVLIPLDGNSYISFYS
ncbi:DUF4397 domain-containing protein [Clostridiaceae bacterium 14S0207]|nr:DUF4397 domain-containing protein [Clostridiaceae bacterium 14S0207]